MTTQAINRLKRMTKTGTPVDSTYTDSVLADILSQYTLPDIDGNQPGSDDWTPTYDLHAAASQIWEEKAAFDYDKFDFSAVGDSYSRTGLFNHAMKMAAHHNARRAIKAPTIAGRPRTRLTGEANEI